MSGKPIYWVVLASTLLSTVGLAAAPPQAGSDSQLPPTRALSSLANSPDDTSPTPEKMLLAAGVKLTIPAMTDVLGDPSRPAEIRYWAAIALGRSGDSAARPALTTALESQDPDIRYGAVMGLGELGKGVGVLAAALDDPEAGIRAAVVQALGRVGDSEAQRLLVHKLLDPEERHDEIRMNAAFELGRLQTRITRQALRLALDDGSAEVRAAAALGLAHNGIRAAVPTLVAVALDPLTEEWLRVDAITTLEKMCGESFRYIKPYAAPTTPQERAAALASIEEWWASHQSSYR